MKASPLSLSRLTCRLQSGVGFKLPWAGGGYGLPWVGFRSPWVAMGGFRSPWIAVGGFRSPVWLWVGLDRVSGHGVVARRGPPRFTRLGPQ